MSTPQVHSRLRARLRLSTPFQIGFLVLLWALGAGVARFLGLPVPGGVLGLFALLALLATGGLRPGTLRKGARWLMAEMLLFFVPAVLALLDHREFLGLLGLKILAVIGVGTLSVMVSTALVLEACHRWGARHAA